MKRFLLLALLACGPALANERAEQEANLIALSSQIAAAMQDYVPEVAGVRCVPKSLGEDWTDYPFRPMIQSTCRWADKTGAHEAVFHLSFDGDDARRMRDGLMTEQAAIAGKEPPEDPVRFYTQGDAIADVRLTGFNFVLPSGLVGSVTLDRRGALGPPDTLDALAQAIVAMDGAALMALPEVQAYPAALAENRRLLESHRPLLAAMLPMDREGRDPATTQPDYDGKGNFYYYQPTAETTVNQAGVLIEVTLTTAYFPLKNAEKILQDLREKPASYVGLTYEDQGRVQVILVDDALTAVIDGRGLLSLEVVGFADGADPVAAMRAVLAQIAGNDFSGF